MQERTASLTAAQVLSDRGSGTPALIVGICVAAVATALVIAAAVAWLSRRRATHTRAPVAPPTLHKWGSGASKGASSRSGKLLAHLSGDGAAASLVRIRSLHTGGLRSYSPTV